MLHSPTSQTYWVLLLPQGATGSTGVAGNDGAAGPTGATGATGLATLPPASSWNGIPYTVTAHSVNATSAPYAAILTPGTITTQNASAYTLVPTSCTGNLYLYTSGAATFTLSATTTIGSSGTTLGSPCTLSANTSCTLQNLSITGGTLLTLTLSSISAALNFTTAFSCQ